MNIEIAGSITTESPAMAQWRIMLRDEVSLLAMPGAHHKTLIRQAHALHQGQMIDADELGDLLELADAALAYAVESLLDLDADE